MIYVVDIGGFAQLCLVLGMPQLYGRFRLCAFQTMNIIRQNLLLTLTCNYKMMPKITICSDKVIEIKYQKKVSGLLINFKFMSNFFSPSKRVLVHFGLVYLYNETENVYQFSMLAFYWDFLYITSDYLCISKIPIACQHCNCMP